jgi:hypothetical protein
MHQKLPPAFPRIGLSQARARHQVEQFERLLLDAVDSVRVDQQGDIGVRMPGAVPDHGDVDAGAGQLALA